MFVGYIFTGFSSGYVTDPFAFVTLDGSFFLDVVF